MACYHPIPAYQAGNGEPVRLWPPVGTATLELPCGSCLGCKTQRATDWARRAEHEAKQWRYNTFLTLTYRPEKCPDELQPKALQRFLKRLRQARARDWRRKKWDTSPHLGWGPKLRYLACGEYGDQTQRPHYHLCLFNCSFADSYRVGKDLYASPTLHELWPDGEHRLGELTGASANYVAQYTLKKIGKNFADADGVLLEPPFLRASLKPALGYEWLEKYKNDLAHGYLVTEGRKQKIPRSYKNKLKEIDGELAERSQVAAEQHPRRRDNLDAAEQIHRRRAELAQRRTL